jgi:RNA polymerase sigma-70 factor, ECF subfamily
VRGVVVPEARELDLEEADQYDPKHQLSERIGVAAERASNTIPSTLEGLRPEDANRLIEFVRRDHAKVRQIVRALCGPYIDVDGVVAEATARAVERLATRQPIGELRPWVTTTAMNLGRSELRHQAVRRRRAPVMSALTESDAEMESVPSRLDLRNALRGLPRRQAEIIALYYGLDLSISEIASSLHRSDGTVKTTLFKARKSLEAALGHPDGGDHDE